MSGSRSPATAAGSFSAEGLAVAGRRVGAMLAVVAIVLAVAVLRLEAQQIGYVAALAAAAALYFARGLGEVRWWGAYILGFLAFAYIRTLADETGVPWRYGYAIELEEAVALGRIPSVWLQERWFTAGEAGPFDVAMFGVYVSYFIVPQLAGILVWRASRERFRLYVVATLATFYSGLLIGFLAPTAPPWLAAKEGYLPDVYRVIMEVTSETETGAREAGYSLASANPVGAMPSLHIAITVIVALAWWRGTPLRVAGALYVGAMGLALVYLGEHYAVDLIAGAALALAAWFAASRYLARRTGERAAGQSPDRGARRELGDERAGRGGRP